MSGTRARLQVRDHVRLAQLGSFLTVSSYTVCFPKLDGQLSEPTKRVDVYRRDAVAGLLHRVRNDGVHDLFFVRQFRFSTTIDADSGQPDLSRDGMIVELMAGMKKPAEPWVEAFRRETREETGYELADEEFITSFYPSPGACSEQIHLFYGRVAVAPGEVDARVGWGADADEETERLVMSPREFLAQVESGEIRDAKCLAAAEWMRRDANRGRFGL
ncbi:MAG: NUDIX hydrolase [Alphaproteobacteria bacterium]|mgnify:CR=1 FL=1|nr:NUDIX hydrolase [Alphaproteobacteria bacterium]